MRATFVEALEIIGSKKLVVAGISTEVYAVIEALGQILGEYLRFYGNLFDNYLAVKR